MSSSRVPLATKPDAPARRASASTSGIGVGGEDHHREPGPVFVDTLHRVEPREIGHRQVHQHHVGLDVLGLPAGRDATTGFPRDLDLIHHLQGARQCLTEGWMIVHDQHSHA